jgi:CheY-like chemotaxis protein
LLPIGGCLDRQAQRRGKPKYQMSGGWHGRGALVSVPVANGRRAVVVLVVEDEVLIRCYVADFLRDAGYCVVESASGAEAIAICNSEMSIDIVFTDINLVGGASGWDVAERFRAERPEIAVLYTSGQSIDHGRRVHESAFVAKPYQPREIVNACRLLRAV